MQKQTSMRILSTGISALTIATLMSGTALAWHPNGIITKGVTNVTSGTSAVHAADTTSSAITAKPGDTLKYTIVIRNDSPTSHSYDDMGFTELTDTLPAGVELVSGKISENIGVVKAKGSVTRTITVKVKASAKNGDIIDNKACFTGDATNREAGRKQAGCDHAIVKVVVAATPTPTPVVTPKPTPVVTPTPTPGKGGAVLAQQAPAVLPETGGAGLLSTLIGASALTGAALAYRRSRR